jgi:NAD(P)H-dependent flavin oxidoreductase YrpB (nitropropane dioxygenase family)
MTVIHVCSAVEHGQKAEQAGVDAVIASGTEGGGHSGFEQNTTFCLVPQIAELVAVPVTAGGGVADGRQLVAALALGAEGVYVGTRFIATKECPAHENYKRALLHSKSGDTIALRHGDMSLDFTKPDLGDRGFSIERRGSLRIILDDKVRKILAEHSGLINFDILMKAYTAVPTDQWESLLAAAYIHGDTEKRFFAAGQGVGLIREPILSCQEVIEKFMKEAELALQKMKKYSF